MKKSVKLPEGFATEEPKKETVAEHYRCPYCKRNSPLVGAKPEPYMNNIALMVVFCGHCGCIFGVNFVGMPTEKNNNLILPR